MAIDNLALETIVSDLNAEVEGAFFDKPFALGPQQFALPYHAGGNKENGGRGTFIMAMNPDNPFICFSYDKYSKVDSNSPFFNSLRKLSGTRIKKAFKLRGERIVIIETEIADEALIAENSGYDLILELFPQRPNAYLAGLSSDKVISVYKESHDVFGERYIGRGLTYIPPVKREPLTTAVQDTEQALKYLSRSTGRLFRDCVGREGFPKALNGLLSSRSLYLIDGGIEPYGFGRPDAVCLKTSQIFGVFVADQRQVARQLALEGLAGELRKQTEVAIRKKANLEADLEASKGRLRYMSYGQELLLHQTEIKPQAAAADFDNMHIILNPKLTPVENATLYFRRYRKAKAAGQILAPLIAQTADEIVYLRGKSLELMKGTPQDILELRQELIAEGYLKDKKSAKPRIRKKTAAEPHFLKASDYKIGFGMNAMQNEELTFKIAPKSAPFLHVKDYPGAHVVILAGDSPDTRKLAAELALFLSDLRSGEVMIAPRDKVKKNKARKGLVSLLDYKTIYLSSIRPESLSLFQKALRLS